MFRDSLNCWIYYASSTWIYYASLRNNQWYIGRGKMGDRVKDNPRTERSASQNYPETIRMEDNSNIEMVRMYHCVLCLARALGICAKRVRMTRTCCLNSRNIWHKNMTGTSSFLYLKGCVTSKRKNVPTWHGKWASSPVACQAEKSNS